MKNKLEELLALVDSKKAYNEIVREISLAASSGDDMARQGLPGMIAEKLRLEKELGVRPKVLPIVTTVKRSS